MPFTFSHIAAVLPLLRNRKIRWSATGLVLGSITPDFEKFLRLSAHNGHSHSWASLFYFSCPMALGLAFLFHGVVRNPLIAYLPRALRQRLVRFQRFNWAQYFRRHYGRVLASVLLGAVSHLSWDSFTHRNGEMVTYWPLLQAHWHIGPLWFPTFVALNLLSSVVGIALVLAAVWQLPLGPVPQPPAGTQQRYWCVVGLVALALLAGRLLLATAPLKDIDIIISVLSGAMVGVGVASVRYRLVAAGSRVLR
jgi:hypothetical protein